MQPNTRIAVNTAFIYCRLIIVTGLSLFSTRYILLALGETDFGIYNLIAGVAGLFSFIATTMAVATQRFISYNMGRGDMTLVKEVFYNSLVMHALVAVAVALLVEVGGNWCIGHLLTIPELKIPDARFVLHCVTAGLVGTILHVPYEAVLMANENIFFVSIVQILRFTAIFVGAVVLSAFDHGRLRIYAIIMGLIPIICLGINYLYCVRHYVITHFRIHAIKSYSLIKEMGSFAGWVFIGITCGTLRSQGTAVLLNMFFGVQINAANGVAHQVNSATQQFSASITTAIRPQLTKSAGCSERSRMLTLTYAACKYPFLLVTLAAVPLMIAMPYVLQLWLKDVPEYAVIFCRLMLLATMITLISSGLTSSIEAAGYVKWLHLTAGLMHLVALPAGYILFRLGFAPQLIFWCIVAEECINGFIRVLLARRYLYIDGWFYLRHVVLCSIAVAGVVAACDYFIWQTLSPTFLHLLFFFVLHTCIFIGACALFGLNRREKELVKNMAVKMRNRLQKSLV